jgi:hypothetical protein
MSGSWIALSGAFETGRREVHGGQGDDPTMKKELQALRSLAGA